ncbi:MAG: N-acetylmuramoyl-L-alanine amidase family protein [Bacillota bacterium]
MRHVGWKPAILAGLVLFGLVLSLWALQARPGYTDASPTTAQPAAPPAAPPTAPGPQPPAAPAPAGPDLQAAAPPNAPGGSTAPAGGKVGGAGALAGLTIVVDPGHGGDISWNGGAVGVTGLLEKDVNLAMGLALRDALESLGARVVMTRTTDTPASFSGVPDEDPLDATTKIAAASGGDLFVSIHGNWWKDPTPNGIETYYYPGSAKGRAAAAALADSLARATGMPTRGPMANNYYVLHYHEVPATLLEIGYLSNPDDEALLRTKAFRAKVVEAIVSGIRNYFNR